MMIAKDTRDNTILTNLGWQRQEQGEEGQEAWCWESESEARSDLNTWGSEGVPDWVVFQERAEL